MVVEAIKCAPIKSDSRGNGFRGPQGLAMDLYIVGPWYGGTTRVQELCESRGGRPGLSVLMSLTVFVNVKQH